MTAPATTAVLPATPRRAWLDGVLAVLLALGLTELAAGVFGGVPSALSSIGGLVVDRSPSWVKDFAISTLGTADKGALAIGTVVVAMGIGALVGALAVRRFWIAIVAFSGFALAGVAAQLGEPFVEPVLTVICTTTAAAAGLVALRLLYRADRSAAGTTDPDAAPGDANRRQFVMLAGAVALGGAISLVVGRQMIIGRSDSVRAASSLPEPVTRAVPLHPENSFTTPGLTPIVVPARDFYRIDTALIVPIVDGETWRLKVTGMVDRDVELTLDDLNAMPQHERYVTIACVSNGVGDDLVGNAKWQGVRLVDVLEMAGVQSGAGQLVGRSVDGWTAGFPTEAAFDGRDPLIAIGMNGEPLPRNHGYPARLIVPGLYGYVSATKWLEEIELTTWDGFDAYWVPKGWAKEGPIKTQSRIDRPQRGQSLPRGQETVAGVAWAPTRGVERVEVQLDDGPWIEAELSEPLSDDAWVQWRARLDFAGPGGHRLRVRATDGTGATQPEELAPPRPDGATGWHAVPFNVE